MTKFWKCETGLKVNFIEMPRKTGSKKGSKAEKKFRGFRLSLKNKKRNHDE